MGLIRSRATPNADGSYAIDGTKIWITGGEHDLTNNIVHLVLAKLPGAPDTTKGISLFIVPKVLPESGERNPVFCGGLEHKMGIKGSATCVINFENAKGWMVGEPNDGMRAMFTMMNEARFKLSLKGGQLVRTLFGVFESYLKDNPEAPHRDELKGAVSTLEKATLWLATKAPKDPEQAGAAEPFDRAYWLLWRPVVRT